MVISPSGSVTVDGDVYTRGTIQSEEGIETASYLTVDGGNQRGSLAIIRDPYSTGDGDIVGDIRFGERGWVPTRSLIGVRREGARNEFDLILQMWHDNDNQPSGNVGIG